ncbi:DUF2752 domain-containing protein [Lachnotalea glycerini]|uniref:DUF2752 domain-containing protein n=1 Tax=Lachnotalea glycerini TaxID=1763509 RepID=A0A371JHI3_9FIRM|nr:DUF2752 domain-containing protein [Lachnotalea glycerini]
MIRSLKEIFMNTDNDKMLYQIGLVLLILALFTISLIYLFHIHYEIFLFPCLFHKLTGLYCPGCGGTRSVHALLHGHPLVSLQYNPIVVYCVCIYICYMFSNTIEILSKHKIKIGMKYRDCYIMLGLILILIFFIIRNILLIAFHIDLTII